MITLKDLICNALCAGSMTAIQTALAIGEKTSSVSSVMKKLCDEGALVRTKGKGPRGGYVYRLWWKKDDGQE